MKHLSTKDQMKKIKAICKKNPFSKIKGDSIIVYLNGGCLPWHRVRELAKDSYIVDTGTYFKNTHLSKICCFPYKHINYVCRGHCSD